MNSKKKSILCCVLIFLIAACFQVSVFTEEITSISSVIEFDKVTYIPGDSISISLKLNGIQSVCRTNSVAFEIEYDSSAFELAQGNPKDDIVDGYIAFPDKNDIHINTGKRKAVAMFTSMRDITLQNDAVVLSLNLKVKENASSGSKVFTLLPVNMFDTNFNIYDVNDGRSYTEDVIINVKQGSTPKPTDIVNTPTPTDMVNIPTPTNIANTPIPTNITNTPTPTPTIINTPKPTKYKSNNNSNSKKDRDSAIEPTPIIPGSNQENSITLEAESDKNTFGQNKEKHIDKNGDTTTYRFGGSRDNLLKFNNITVDSDGVYELTIIYSNGEGNSAKGFIKVNDENSMFLRFEDTGGWDTLSQKTVKVYLKKGNNTIAFFNNSKESVALDKITFEEDFNSVISEGDILFVDINKHWAEQILLSLAEQGLIEGYPDDTARPDLKITRAQMCTIIVNALELEVPKDIKLDFKDNDKIPDWAAGHIQTAVNKGIVVGYEDNTFRAENILTRSEMVTMVVKAFGYAKSKETEAKFTDLKDIPVWAQDYVYTACNRKLLKGYPDNTIRPMGGITRAEAAALIYQCQQGLEG